MKRIYLFICTFLAYSGYLFNLKIFLPITKFVMYKLLNSKKSLRKNFRSLDDNNFAFPNGVIDWYAFSGTIAIFLLPLALLPSIIDYKFKSENGYKIYLSM